MATPVVGIPFRGKSKEEANATRAILNEIAEEHGYLATAGPTKGKGSFGALALAMASGELAVIQIANTERFWLIAWLMQQAADGVDAGHRSTLRQLAEQIRWAAERDRS